MSIEFYTLKQSAAILQISKRTVQRHLKRIGYKSGLGRPRLTEEVLKRIAGGK